MAEKMKAVHVFPIGAGPDKGPLSYFTLKEVEEGDTVEIKIRGRKVLGIVDKVESIGTSEPGNSSGGASGLKAAIKKSPYMLKKIENVLGKTLHGGAIYKTARLLARYYLSHPGLTLAAIRPAIFEDNSLTDIRPTPSKNSPKDSTDKLKPRLMPTLIQTSKEDRVIYFKKLIREYFAKKESVAIILPTVQEAKHWRDLLSKGIAEHTLLFTGDENKKSQKETVRRAAESAHPLLLVGTFFAAVLPVQRLGAIIVEHESSGLYETRRRPIIDRRLAAEVFAHACGIPIYFSDSLLQLKTSSRIKLGTAHSVERLSYRIHGKTPEIYDQTPVSGPRGPFGDKGRLSFDNRTGFQALSNEILEEIKKAVDLNRQVFVFAFRKNYASTTVCRDCGQGVACPNCGHALALLSDSERVFYCPRCDENKSANIVCERCSSWNLVPLGVGIDRVKEELISAGLGSEITRIDGRRKELDMDIAAREFADRKKKILLGTEAAFSRLPSDESEQAGQRVDLAVVASLDSLFAMPIYDAPERAAHLIMRLVESAKRTIIQTRHAGEDVFENARRGSFSEFAENEFLVRSALGYPPYRRLISLTFSGKAAAVAKATEKLEGLFADYRPEFFEMPEDSGGDMAGRLSARMRLKLEPELWPLIPKNDSDVPDEDLYLKLLALPKAIKIDVE